MKKYFFIELGFIFCKAEQPQLMKDFLLKHFLKVKAVNIRKKKCFNDQSNVVDFHLWSLLPLDNPQNAQTLEYFDEFNGRCSRSIMESSFFKKFLKFLGK